MSENNSQNHVIRHVARCLSLSLEKTQAITTLLDEGATIPFVARYRKEITGGMDEVALQEFLEMLTLTRELLARKASILKSLQEREILNPKLQKAIEEAETKTALEDLYLPYRPKRRTRAQKAREAGLEPLAHALWEHQHTLPSLQTYINPEAGITAPEEALAGARDILAERIGESPEFRPALREKTLSQAKLQSTATKKRDDSDAAAVYSDYFHYSESLRRMPSHRILALLRGAREGHLRIKARLDSEDAVEWLTRRTVKSRGAGGEQVRLATEDAWKRLMAPSLESEMLSLLKQRADEEAITVFAQNLEQMLLAPPLGPKALIAIDPGFRTGGKVAVLDSQGNLKEHGVIHPEGSSSAQQAAQQWLEQHAKKNGSTIFAVGNGTAGRETETFLKKHFPSFSVLSVDERGASVYSASPEARREFGDLDLTIRGAISIGRRLQDPLAELVKIDPASIGVGQYQHDVDAKALEKALSSTVESAVNKVGVELNTASPALLSRVSGVGPKLAEAIVNYRNTHGPYTHRTQLLKVPRLGAKAYEQCAGFLRIAQSSHPLDASAVHPERYALVERMANDLQSDVHELMSSPQLQAQVQLQNYVDEKAGVGFPTLKDIMAELAKPGRDPRGELEEFHFDERIHNIEDLVEGMILPGMVTNVTAFGAFVDVGAHRDGLVHISELANQYVSVPSDVISVRDVVKVKVLDVDLRRGRVALSIRQANEPS